MINVYLPNYYVNLRLNEKVSAKTTEYQNINKNGHRRSKNSNYKV